MKLPVQPRLQNDDKSFPFNQGSLEFRNEWKLQSILAHCIDIMSIIKIKHDSNTSRLPYNEPHMCAIDLIKIYASLNRK